MYIILTPNEYYIELPALAINAASNKPGLAASASHTASFIKRYIYSSVQYIYTAALFYHDCTEFKKTFILYFRLVSC